MKLQLIDGESVSQNKIGQKFFYQVVERNATKNLYVKYRNWTVMPCVLLVIECELLIS